AVRLAPRALEVRVGALERPRVAAQPLLLAPPPLDVAQHDRAQLLARELEHADRDRDVHALAAPEPRRQLEIRAPAVGLARVALAQLGRRALQLGQELRHRCARETERVAL